MLSASVLSGWGVRSAAAMVLLTSAAWSVGQASESAAHGKDDSAEVIPDGGGQEILQSIFIPPMAHAPFSLTLATEWSRPLNNGGSFTVVNVRPIKRDSAGRIYEERWALVPKGSGVRSTLSWIQIADPAAHTQYNCNAARKACDLLDYEGSTSQRYAPSLFKSGPLPNGAGMRTHEDLGVQSFQGVPVHGYRDTTTLNPGVMGNDLPMSTVREFSYAAELGVNLRSVLDSPHVGKQTFTVTEISTTEPDPSYFVPPEGWPVVDRRKAAVRQE